MSSEKANKYGTAVEYKLAEAYDLELARASCTDAHDRRRGSLLLTLRWHGDGEHRGTSRAKVAVSDVS